MEVEVLPLISALLVLIVLIPMIPYSMGEILNDVFEIFRYLDIFFVFSHFINKKNLAG